MRTHALNAFFGALGLAAIAASAPALSSLRTPDDCIAPSTETVFVTVPVSSPKPSTVYVTIPVSSVEVNLNEAPTSTLTRFATLYSTTTSPHTLKEYTSAGQVNDPYHSTITETAVVTITNVNLTPLPFGGSLTYSETAAPNGIINYVVKNGTTYWLDGQTPAPYQSYVYATSSVTVVPVDPTEWASEKATSTLTLHSTIYSTKQYTFTETLESALASSGRIGTATSASAGTGLPYTKGSGGWNATKTSSVGGISSGATNAVLAASAGAGLLATGSPSFVLYSTFNIYETRHSTISLSSLAAKSGFYAFSTTASGPVASSISAPATATSGSSGEITTAVINGKTVTWGGSSAAANTPLDTCTESPYPSSTGAPYANSTFAPSARATSTVSGAITSLSSISSNIGFGSSSALVNSTTFPSSVSSILSSLSTLIGPYSSSAVASSTRSVLPLLSSSLASYNSSSVFIGSTSSGSVLGGLTPSTSSPTIVLSSSSSQPVYQSSSTVPSSTVGSSSVASSSAAVNSSSFTLSSVYSSKSSTTVSSTASSTPSLCGEYGDFLLNFDDIPPLSIGNQNPNTVTPEPVFNPYHQFDFSDGFVVVPPPTDPYLPSSPPLLLEFIPNFNINGTNTQVGPNSAEEGYSGQISDGDGDRTGCFRFNVYGASFGCDSQGPECGFTFSGYQLNASRKEVQIASQSIAVPACPALANCTLTPVTLDKSFENLAFVRINVTVAQQTKIWWMDDLRLGWYNNSCTTGLCRQTAHLS